MRKSLKLSALILAATAFLALAPAASAQYQYNYSNNIWVNSGMNLLFQKRWETARIRAAGKNELADALEGRSTNAAQAAPAENPLRRAPLSATAFERRNARFFELSMVVSLMDEPEENTRVLHQVMGELLDNYDKMLVANGETRLKNNVAGAAAFALIMSRSVLTDGKELSEKQAEALLQDINALLASSDNFRKLPDMEKQKMYEAFVVVSGLSAMLYQEGTQKGEAETVGKGKELARSVLSAFFDRPLEEIRFTDGGVEFGN